jgi:hypothetical protein
VVSQNPITIWRAIVAQTNGKNGTIAVDNAPSTPSIMITRRGPNRSSSAPPWIDMVTGNN